MQIRDALIEDFETIVFLNKVEVQQTSPMDLERLTLLYELSAYHKVATITDQLAGFVLAFSEGTPYKNRNYQWFASRYRRFLYIDRIVVSRTLKGNGIGSALYRDLIGYAQSTGVESLLCEYNIEPPNTASRAFHENFGFREVGRLQSGDSSRLVSLQALEIQPLTGS